MATIKDVAKEAGVSQGTITRYFNNESLKEENRKRIEEAVIKLDYKVNTVARSLRSKKSYSIGVIVTSFKNQFISSILTAIENYFIDKGYSIIVCTSMDDYKIERKKLEFLVEKRIDGLIIIPTKGVKNSMDILKSLEEKNIPIVTVDNFIDDLKCSSVMVDNINGTYAAAEHLVTNGHKRIGIITGPDDYATSIERLRGFKRALSDFNLSADHELIKQGGYTVNNGYDAMRYFSEMQLPPTAILATSYDLTLGALLYITEKSLQIPDDFSFLGFDAEEFSKIMKPQISVVLQPLTEIGQKAAEVMYKHLKDEDYSFDIFRLKTKMIVTSSIKKLN